jgi:hypothetical protein
VLPSGVLTLLLEENREKFTMLVTPAQRSFTESLLLSELWYNIFGRYLEVSKIFFNLIY